MPIYEYKCDKCCIIFEGMCHANCRNDPAECPECGQLARRLFSTFSFKWVGRILEWGKPDRTVAREEDLLEYDGQRSKEDSANVGRKSK